MSKLADLATKKFTSKDFEEELARVLAKKKAKTTPVSTSEVDPNAVWQDLTPPLSTPEETDEIDLDTNAPSLEEAKRQLGTTNGEGGSFWDSKIGKGIDWLNEPLSGDYFARKGKEAVDAIPERELVKHTGGKNKLQDFIAEVTAMAQGFERGVRGEGAGRAMDSLTTPSTFLSLAGGGLAAKGLKGAGAITRAIEATQIPHGLKTAMNKDEGLVNRAFGALEAVGGAAGAFGGTNTAKPVKAKAPETSGHLNLPTNVAKPKPAGIIDRAVAKNQTPPDIPPAGEVVAEAPFAKASDEQLQEFLYHEDPAIQEAAAAEVQKRDPNFNGGEGNPELAGSTQSKQATEPEVTPEPEVKVETPEEMTARLFPGMKRGGSKFNLSGVKDFLADEQGHIDLSKLFQGEEDLGYSTRTNHPDTVDLGEVSNRPDIDLNEESLRAGSEDARPVSSFGDKVRNFLTEDSGEVRYDNPRGKMVAEPDLGTVPAQNEGPQLPHEFSPDMMQQADEVFGGTSPRFMERPAQPDTPRMPSSFSERLMATLGDETGSVPREPRLVKPDGSTVVPKKYDIQGREVKAPLSEDAQIEQLTKDAMAAADRERSASLKAGEIELTPEQLEGFRSKMQSGEKFAEEALGASETPPLRSKDHMDIPPESQKSANRRASGIWGGVNDTFKEPQPRLASPLQPPDVSPTSSKFEDFIKNLYRDDKGELNLSGLFGEEEVNPNPMPLLPDKESLRSGVPIQERNVPGSDPESTFVKMLNAPKGTMSADLPFISSAAFRQAKFHAWSKEWFEGWGEAAKAYGSDDAAYKAMEDSWKQSKYFKPRYKPKYDVNGEITGYKEMPSPAEEIGVHLLKKGNDLEQFGSELAERIPSWGQHIKRSNQAFRAFLNHIKVTKTEELLDQLKWTGTENDQTVTKALGNFINDSTGSGSLKWAGPGGRELDLERVMPVLKHTMWAPRLLAANSKFLNPFTYTSLPPQVRQQYINSALRMATTWGTFATLGKMAGAEVNLNPTNSDFGKIKLGDTRFDPAGGMQQLIVYLARMAPERLGRDAGEFLGTPGGFDTGKFTSSANNKTREYGTGAFPVTRKSVTNNFMESKLGPLQGLAWSLMNTDDKHPVHLGDKAVQLALPIMAQDIVEAMKNDPTLSKLLSSSIGSSTGLGTNTYGKGDKFNDPVFTDSIEQALGQPQGSLRGTIGKW